MAQILTDNLTILIALFFLCLGYAMGRNSAERPVLSREGEREPKVEDEPYDLPEDQVWDVNDEVPREEDYDGRVGTV